LTPSLKSRLQIHYNITITFNYRQQVEGKLNGDSDATKVESTRLMKFRNFVSHISYIIVNFNAIKLKIMTQMLYSYMNRSRKAARS